jgi:Cytochrome P460
MFKMSPTRLVAGALCSAALISAFASGPNSMTSKAQAAPATALAYTADDRLEFPKSYRTWVYLSSGLDMSYMPAPLRPVSTFGNVFVNPEAYDAFVATGTWPDKTALVLEVRRAEQNASINRAGRSQGDILHTELHVKDVARFEGGWGFFRFADETAAAVIPRTANCYSCHQEHAAVDTTFVQFYPTLLAIARAKNTLTGRYLAEETNGARK